MRFCNAGRCMKVCFRSVWRLVCSIKTSGGSGVGKREKYLLSSVG